MVAKLFACSRDTKSRRTPDSKRSELATEDWNLPYPCLKRDLVLRSLFRERGGSKTDQREQSEQLEKNWT